MKAPLDHLILALLLVGAATTLGFMIDAGEPDRPWWWLAFSLFGGWALVPYALVAAATRWRPANRASRSVLCAAAALLSGLSILSLYSAFVIHLDAQSALVFIFLPLWQLVGLLPFLGASRWIAQRGQHA